MADEARPKLAQIPQGRELTPHSVKVEEDDEERRHRPKPLHLPLPPSNSAGSVTLPSFRETYGMTLGGYGAPPPPPPPPSGHPSAHGPPPPPLVPPHPSLPAHSAHHDPARSVPGPRPYPDSPGSTSRPGPPPGVGNGGAPDYGRYHPHDAYRDSKEYYASYPPYHSYPDRPSYWAPSNYQPPPPESAPRQRTSIACKYCRKRKIRCSGYQNTPDGKCTNCKKTGNDCVFQPVSSTTSTAFVPVSAIQGGVPPGTPLYGAFGQPLGPNGGRGPSGQPTSAGPNVPGGPPGSHSGMNGPPPPPTQPGYGPVSPASGGYYHQHLPPPMDHNGPPSHGPPHGPSSHGAPTSSSQQHPPPPPPPGGPSSMMGQRQLPPLPYPHGHPGYPPDDRMARAGKRPRDDEEVDFSNRLPPPPPNYNHISHGSHGSHGSNGYYGASDDSRAYSDTARRSPPSMNGSNHSAVSPASNGHRGYNTPVPPVLPPPGPMSSVGTDTSVRSSGSTAGTAVTSPTERHMSRSPSGDPEDHAKIAESVRYAQQPTSGYNGYDYSAREWAPAPGREIDRTMLDRLGTSSTARSESRCGYRTEGSSSQWERA